MKQARWLCGAAVACLLSQDAHAEKTLEVRTTHSAARFFFDAGFSRLTNQDDQSIQAVTGAIGAIYGVTSKWGIFGQIQQAFSSGGLSSVYSLLEVGGSYAVLGDLKGRSTQVVLQGVPVVSSIDGQGQAVRVSLFADQYFINTSTRVLGLAGFGASLHYDHPLNDRLGLTFSLRYARASNNTLTIKPMQVSAGISF
jgi:hypothetical protein